MITPPATDILAAAAPGAVQRPLDKTVELTVGRSVAELRDEIGRYHQALLNVACRVTNDAELSRDIVQDAYVAVLESAEKFKGASSLKTYLYRIVINRCIDARRRRTRWLSFLDAWRSEPARPHVEPGDRMDHQKIVRQLFDGIPDAFRIPLVLAEVDGMKYDEIALTLGVSMNTVRTRIFRCREKLRQAYAKTGRLP
jgi:RNA polymerase sigma-70 factor (ECF subfamily)